MFSSENNKIGYLEEQYEILHSSVIALTSHFSQVPIIKNHKFIINYQFLHYTSIINCYYIIVIVIINYLPTYKINFPLIFLNEYSI